MTRRSRRELERELERLGSGATAATVREFVDGRLAGGFDVDLLDARDGDGGRVVVYRGDGFTVDVAAGEVPEWIDEADLPVHA